MGKSNSKIYGNSLAERSATYYATLQAASSGNSIANANEQIGRNNLVACRQEVRYNHESSQIRPIKPTRKNERMAYHRPQTKEGRENSSKDL